MKANKATKGNHKKLLVVNDKTASTLKKLNNNSRKLTSPWKRFFLLFFSVLRSLWNQKVQILSLIMVVLIGGLVFNALYTTRNEVQNSYNALVKNANQQQAVVTLNTSSLATNFTTINNTTLPNNYLAGFKKAVDSDFGVNQVSFAYYDTRNFYSANFQSPNKPLGQTTRCFFKAIPYNATYNETTAGGLQVSRPYLASGSWPKDKGGVHYVTVSPLFAKAQKLNLGDKIEINNASFVISGFAYAPNFIYPQLSLSQEIPSTATSTVVFCDPNSVYTLGENIFNPVSTADREIFLGVRFHNKASLSTNINKLAQVIDDPKNTFNDGGTTPKTAPLNAIFPKNPRDFIYNSNSPNYLFFQRTALILTIIKATNYLSYGFILFAIFITAILLFVIAIKRIDNDRILIGTFLALGYSKRFIFLAYTAYPFVISVFGCLLGWAISFGFFIPVSALFYNYFAILPSSILINWIPLIVSIGLVFLFLMLFTFAAFWFVARKGPVDLLYEKHG